MLRCDSKYNYRNCQNQFWTQYPVNKKVSLNQLQNYHVLCFVLFHFEQKSIFESKFDFDILFMLAVVLYTVSCILFTPVVSMRNMQIVVRRQSNVNFVYSFSGHCLLIVYWKNTFQFVTTCHFRIDDDLVWPQYRLRSLGHHIHDYYCLSFSWHSDDALKSKVICIYHKKEYRSNINFIHKKWQFDYDSDFWNL